jgi:hypothetical protein
MIKLAKTLKGLNKLLEQTRAEFNEHKQKIKDSGKKYTARDKKSTDFKKQLVFINDALKQLKDKNELKKIIRKKIKNELTLKPHDKQQKIFNLIDASDTPAE